MPRPREIAQPAPSSAAGSRARPQPAGNVDHEFDELGSRAGRLGCLAMPSYVARPHVLANKFVPGYLGDSFGLLPFVHGNPLANHFDGPFLVRLIRKEVTNMSGFPFGIEGRDPDIPSCWHSGTMRRSCCWSIPCHNQADPLPTNDTPASDIPQRFQCPAMLGDGGVGMRQKEMATTAAGKNRIMIFGPKDDASTSLSLGRPRACDLRAAGTGRHAGADHCQAPSRGGAHPGAARCAQPCL
jgi:hypothetical protein